VTPSTTPRKAGCPSTLTLDELEAGDLEGRPEEPALREHVRTCADCRARIAARAADPALSPDPKTMRALLAASAPPAASTSAAPARWRPRRRFALATLSLAGAAAAALLVVRAGDPTGRAPQGDAVKGALALTVHIRQASGTIVAVNDDGELRPGEQMRFSLTTSAAGHAVVLGLDASPAVTTYVPAAPAAEATPIEAPGAVELAGSIAADATAGFERVVAVVCPRPVPIAALRQQAERALRQAGGRPEAVSSLGTGCAESGVLLRKVRGP